MLQHERLCSWKEVIDEDHGMIVKRLGGEDLSQCNEIGMLELFPLVDENHALGVDQAEPVDTSQHHALPVFSVGSFVY